MIRVPLPKNADVVDMLRGFAKLHRIKYHEIAVQSGTPASTVGGIMGKYQQVGVEKLSALWKACLLLAAEKVELLRLGAQAAHLAAETSRHNLERIKNLIATS